VLSFEFESRFSALLRFEFEAGQLEIFTLLGDKIDCGLIILMGSI
jgi:hypothetical protein